MEWGCLLEYWKPSFSRWCPRSTSCFPAARRAGNPDCAAPVAGGSLCAILPRGLAEVQVFGSVATELNLVWSDLDLVLSGVVPCLARDALSADGRDGTGGCTPNGCRIVMQKGRLALFT